MRTRLLAMVVLAALILPSNIAWAAWTDVWTSGPNAGGTQSVTTVKAGGRAYLRITSSALDTDASPFIKVTSKYGTTLCMDTDVSTITEQGTASVSVFWSVSDDSVAADSVKIGSNLTFTKPCLFSIPPGVINVVLTANASTTGEIRLQGNGSGGD